MLEYNEPRQTYRTSAISAASAPLATPLPTRRWLAAPVLLEGAADELDFEADDAAGAGVDDEVVGAADEGVDTGGAPTVGPAGPPGVVVPEI